jgi:hypothetical protein
LPNDIAVQPGLSILILLAAAAGPAADGGTAGPEALIPAEAAADLDFSRDVQPLFQRHCVRCHNDKRRSGGLSLIARGTAERGGASGLNPLAKDEHNELLRRLRSTDPEEQMPLESPPLSAAEIDLLSRWINAGAPWPEMPTLSQGQEPPSNPSPKSVLDLLGAWLDLWDRAKLERLRPAAWAMITVLMAVVVLERMKRRLALRPEVAGFWAGLGQTPRAAYVAAMLAVAVYGVALYARGLRTDLATKEQEHAEMRAELQVLRSEAADQTTYDDNEIYWPKHPPRLGGTYYRGNDERSERLFNGGIYLTATFELELLDREDRVLKAGDLAEGPLVVRLRIRRAPHATPQLFADSALGSACLSPIAPPTAEPVEPEESDGLATEVVEIQPTEPGPTTGGPYLLEALEPGEYWEARAPLPAAPADKALVGMLYLYTQRKVADDEAVDRPHYAISYRLKLDAESRLTKDSTLHLGSMYNVAGVFAIPEDRMAPSEWFDYRPLPVIEGEHTDDGKLLGVEEQHPGVNPRQ